MKDKFFKLLKHAYELIYSSVLKTTYSYYAIKLNSGLTAITRSDRKRVKKYWRTAAGRSINTLEYRWYKHHGVDVNPQIIPNTIYHSRIEPHFNNIHMFKAFADKNYADLLIGREYTPRTLFHCINNQLLNEDYLPVDENFLDALPEEVILKPSIDSGSGRNIKFIKKESLSKALIAELKQQYNGNFIVQEPIKQHSFLAGFNPYSTNTLRVVSFLYNGKVHILSSFLKVGAAGSRTDNVSSGGHYIPLDRNWRLKQTVIREDLDTRDLICQEREHDSYESRLVPCYDKIASTIEALHYRLAHFGLINWDVSLDENERVIIIEYNLIDSSPSFHQLPNGPIFGELTDDVLKEVFK